MCRKRTMVSLVSSHLHHYYQLFVFLASFPLDLTTTRQDRIIFMFFMLNNKNKMFFKKRLKSLTKKGNRDLC